MVFLALKLGSPLLLVFTTLLRRVRQWYRKCARPTKQNDL
jgi:hypothetical protein